MNLNGEVTGLLDDGQVYYLSIYLSAYLSSNLSTNICLCMNLNGEVTGLLDDGQVARHTKYTQTKDQKMSTRPADAETILCRRDKRERGTLNLVRHRKSVREVLMGF